MSLEEGILNCLGYFGLFKYPLTLEEIHRFGHFSCTLLETKEGLKDLINRKKVFKFSTFYTTENIPELAKDRVLRNKRAELLLQKIDSYVRTIAHFPFVRAISISGSLSKFSAGKDADIDYFIITKANRLWIARTLLHLFKKLTFITHHQHYFCMNYFIDEEALAIKDNNIYSAIEIATLLPVYNETLIQEFKNANLWAKKFLPNEDFQNNNDFNIKLPKKIIIKNIFEFIFNVFAPDKFNRWLMNLTDTKWRKKWSNHGYSAEDYNQAFYTSLHASKNHPENYQKKVLSAYNQKEKFSYAHE